MASTVIQVVADQLKVLLEAVSVTPALKAQVWPRMDLNALPAAEIELPNITRVLPEEAESELGSDDWHMSFPVTIWYDLRDPKLAQQRIAEAVEKWIQAIDTNRDLALVSGTVRVLDAVVSSAEKVYDATDNTRPLIGYETTVEVWGHV